MSQTEDTNQEPIDGASIMIECYSDGEVGFACDWQQDDTGISCVATLLTYFGDKNFPDLIIKNIEANVQSDDQIEQLEKIKSFYGALKKIKEENNKLTGDDVVVPPLDASNLM